MMPKMPKKTTLTPNGRALVRTMRAGEGDAKGRLEGPDYNAKTRALLARLEAGGFVRPEYDGHHERPRAFVLTNLGWTVELGEP